jgi:ABC-type ATPase with predicted acetyltransferase domain
MYIYNVTINIQEEVHDQWLEWMKKEHIPEMLSTGKFSKALMSRVMVEEPMGGITYSVQYTTEGPEMLKRYYEEDARRLRSRSRAFEGKFVAFRTEMDVVSEQ